MSGDSLGVWNFTCLKELCGLLLHLRDRVRRSYTAPDGIDLDGLRYVTRERALKDGTPFFLGSDMRPLEPHCSFFLDLAKTLKAKSLQDYTYDFLDFSDFLGSLDPPSDVLSATEDDLLAYRSTAPSTGTSPCRRPPGSAVA